MTTPKLQVTTPRGRSRCRAALVAILAATHAVAMVAAQPVGFGGLEGVPDKDFTTGLFLRSSFRAEDHTLRVRFIDQGPAGFISITDVDSNRILGTTPSATSQFYYGLKPCAYMRPNVQPSSSQTVTPLNGNLDIGFVNELGTLIRNRQLEEADSFFIPQGLLSYMANLDCTDDLFVISVFSSPDPNPALMFNSFVSLPVSIITAEMPDLTTADVQAFRAEADDGSRPLLRIDPTCATRCGLNT